MCLILSVEIPVYLRPTCYMVIFLGSFVFINLRYIPILDKCRGDCLGINNQYL